MSGLMLYLPGARANDRREIVERGADGLLDPSATAMFLDCAEGPDGGRGKLVIWDCPTRPHATPHQVDRATQTWLPAAKVQGTGNRSAARRYWVGCDMKNPPGPAELERSKLCDGYPVQLTDGKSWIVPVADYLPQRLTRDTETGEELRRPAPEHEEFVAWANRLFEHFMSDGFQNLLAEGNRVQIPRGFGFASAALAKNYRANADVVDLLGLVDDTIAAEVTLVALGIRPFLELAEKKNGSATAARPASSS